MSPETEYRLVVEPVAVALKRANVRNLALERVSEVRTWRPIVDDYRPADAVRPSPTGLA